MVKRAVSVLAATRLHLPEETDVLPEVIVRNLRRFAQSTFELGITAAVAVNSFKAEVEKILREAAPNLEFQVLHVPVWGAFVPALNTLLGVAQSRGDHYILYQSLEVRCARKVLKRLLDHFTKDTLVVGPVLDGHTFEDGEQPLTGRTSPWNTLALWRVRKLGLTGFLSIADGMPQAKRVQVARQLSQEADEEDLESAVAPLPDKMNLPFMTGAGDRQVSGDVLPVCQTSADIADLDLDLDDGETMGSHRWWHKTKGSNKVGMLRQQSEKGLAIPAGVEEVTAIALLQHLLGKDRARAILVQLPSDMESLVTWEAKWANDDRRKAWHEYKMASKVARPAAQIRQLFGESRRRWGIPFVKPLLSAPPTSLTPPSTPGGSGEHDHQELNFGVVFHFSDSIRCPWKVESICIAIVALFSANFAAIFATAFQSANDKQIWVEAPLAEVTFLTLQISAVYLPMPVSLWLTRWVISIGDNIAGLALCAILMLVSHCLVLTWEVMGCSHSSLDLMLLVSRLVAGLGSGVLFQSRFVLASLSTMDHHRALQARQLFAADFGLAFGTMLPWVATAFSGSQTQRPALCTSVVFATLSLFLLFWILICFPRNMHRLPDRIRFLAMLNDKGPQQNLSSMTSGIQQDANEDVEAQQSSEQTRLSWRCQLLLSGTTRVFVQSAVIMALALWMRGVGLTEGFVQTKAIGLVLLLPAPLEAWSSGALSPPSWCASLVAAIGKSDRVREVALLMVGAAMALWSISSLCGPVKDPVLSTGLAGMELTSLLLALALATPLNASRLYALKDAERATVLLEWLKAYIGRILGPLFAIIVQHWLGYGPLLMILSLATVLVAVTV